MHIIVVHHACHVICNVLNINLLADWTQRLGQITAMMMILLCLAVLTLWTKPNGCAPGGQGND